MLENAICEELFDLELSNGGQELIPQLPTITLVEVIELIEQWEQIHGLGGHGEDQCIVFNLVLQASEVDRGRGEQSLLRLCPVNP